MQKTFTVTADWDAEAGVFTSQSDIPSLVVEAATFEEFVGLVEALAPEIIAANLPGAQRSYTVTTIADCLYPIPSQLNYPASQITFVIETPITPGS